MRGEHFFYCRNPLPNTPNNISEKYRMQFDSFTFIIFFAFSLAGYGLLNSWNARKNLLLIASYLFYSAWNPLFLLLLIGSTTADWWIARRIFAAQGHTIRKRWISLTILVNLIVLGYFKYSSFVIENLAGALKSLGIDYQPPHLGIVLPIAISFYTFHSLSYCIDVYRGKFMPTENWRDYALYVGFFPQLVAGPITRWTQMREQIEQPRSFNAEAIALGIALFTLGLFEKVVLADSIFAPVADTAFKDATAINPVSAWMGMLSFSGQIFCDFAGYSTCALGIALAFGFSLPINFRTPYAAIGFSDFWHRWHISLSSWLRDYLYVSLGGNRQGEMKTYRNLLLTMLIGGLWHGAAWKFVVWGAMHGTYLGCERFIREKLWPANHLRSHSLKILYGAITLFGVMYAWVWFRAQNFTEGWQIHQQLFDLSGLINHGHEIDFAQQLSLLIFAALVGVHWWFREGDTKQWLSHLHPIWRGVLLATLLTLIVLSPGENHAFIYFQF